MNKKLKLLLQKMGLTNDQIAQFESTDDAVVSKIDVNALHTEITSGFREALENDEAFMTPLKNSVRAAVLTPKQKSMMKLFGITQEEFDALPKGKEFDELMILAHKKATAKVAAGGGDADEKQKEIDRLNGELTKALDDIKTVREVQIPGIQSKADQTVNGHILFGMITEEVGKNKPIIGVKAAARIVQAYVEKNADMRLNELKDAVNLFQKGKDLKLMGEGNKEIKFSDLVAKACKDEGITAESNAHVKKKAGIKGNGPDDDPENNGGGNDKKLTANQQKALDHGKNMWNKTKKKDPANADE